MQRLSFFTSHGIRTTLFETTTDRHKLREFRTIAKNDSEGYIFRTGYLKKYSIMQIRGGLHRETIVKRTNEQEEKNYPC